MKNKNIIDKINAYFDAEIEEDRDLDEVYNQLEDANSILGEISPKLSNLKKILDALDAELYDDLTPYEQGMKDILNGLFDREELDIEHIINNIN